MASSPMASSPMVACTPCSLVDSCTPCPTDAKAADHLWNAIWLQLNDYLGGESLVSVSNRANKRRECSIASKISWRGIQAFCAGHTRVYDSDGRRYWVGSSCFRVWAGSDVARPHQPLMVKCRATEPTSVADPFNFSFQSCCTAVKIHHREERRDLFRFGDMLFRISKNEKPRWMELILSNHCSAARLG